MTSKLAFATIPASVLDGYIESMPTYMKHSPMLELIKSSIETHGGLARWNQVRQISATVVPDGLALKLRGHEAFAKMQTRVTVDTRGPDRKPDIAVVLMSADLSDFELAGAAL